MSEFIGSVAISVSRQDPSCSTAVWVGQRQKGGMLEEREGERESVRGRMGREWKDENKEFAGSYQDHAVLFSLSMAPHCLATTNQIVGSEPQPGQSAGRSVAP